GRTAARADSRPLSSTAVTTTARPNTNSANLRSAAATRSPIVVRRRSSWRTPRTTTPATAGHTGEMPASEATAKPATVAPTTTRATTGAGGTSVTGSSTGTARSSRNIHRSTAYSTATATI